MEEDLSGCVLGVTAVATPCNVPNAVGVDLLRGVVALHLRKAAAKQHLAGARPSQGPAASSELFLASRMRQGK